MYFNENKLNFHFPRDSRSTYQSVHCNVQIQVIYKRYHRFQFIVQTHLHFIPPLHEATTYSFF